MLINPRSGSVKAGVILVPKRFVIDKAVINSAQGIANTGFAVWVPEMSTTPITMEDVTADQLNEFAMILREENRTFRRTLNGRKSVGVVGAWLGGTVAMMAGAGVFDASVLISPYLQIPVTKSSDFKQPLQFLRETRTPVLAVFGELSAETPISDVRLLEGALSERGGDHEVYTYPGVGHAFFDSEEGNPEYREPAERDLWIRIDQFFEKTVK
ncbi:dienelactone hydrolase family protein [Planctomycetota bacterium]|nr:dienelactone hydrolase family protein [Planctomycetota bacterium]